MEFRYHRLENGLQILAEINPAARSAAVGFFVKTGARDEDTQVSGVSHFLEHMLFKGTQQMDALAVNAAFDRIGAHYNAFTSEENTVYYAAVLPEYLKDVTKLWIELMQPALREQDFEIERQVVLQEIAMYKDQPEHQVVELCRSLHFDGHSCGNTVIGTQASISQLTCQQMREYFRTRYVPDNMVVAFAGNIDWQMVTELVESGCSSWLPGRPDRQIGHFPGTMHSQSAQWPGLACEHICLMHQGIPAQDPRRPAAALLSHIIGDDVGSRYYWQLVDKAIAQTASMQYWPMDGTGAFCSYLACRQGWSDRVLDDVKRILERCQGWDLKQDELTRARNKIASALVIRNELPMGRLIDLALNWVYLGQYKTLQHQLQELDAVTVDQVNELARDIELGRFTAYILRP